MAEAMSGIAGLPTQTAPQAPNNGMTPENLAAFEQMRQEIPPSEFSEDLLSTAAEADPVAVAEFKAELRDQNLPPEVLDLLNQMVDEILAMPEQYAQIRAKYMAQDIPEELLPPTFDAEFFSALNLALDEMRVSTGTPLPPQGFAAGGLATLRPIAAAMADQGRYGDTMLAHISPREAGVLKQMGGSGSINPNTGLPEFFIKKLFKGVGKALKSIGRAVKKFAKSKVGRIVTTLALAFVLGPAAATAMGVSSTVGVAAVSGFVGSAGSTLLAGGNLKDALKAGAIGGIAGGAGAGIFGGAEAFQAGSYTGPTTVGGQLQKAKDFVTGGGGTEAPALDTGLEDVGSQATDIATETVTDAAVDPVLVDSGIPAPPSAEIGRTSLMPTSQLPANTSLTGLNEATKLAMQGDPGQPFRFYEAGRGAVANTDLLSPEQFRGVGGLPVGTVKPSEIELLREVGGQGGNLTPEVVGDVVKDRSLFQRGLDKVLPGRIEDATAQNAFSKVAKDFGTTEDVIRQQILDNTASPAIVEAYTKAATPNLLQKYGPLAAVGIGGLALTGGLGGEEAEPPPGFEDMAAGKSPGMELLRQYPNLYGLNFGGINTLTSSGYNPYGYAKGGTAKFPRKNGAINGAGTGTSDDIPAMLSDGEFVFTAKAVRNMGDGSRRKGAKRMYALMRKLEGRNNV
jgi:hypothetical protein